MYGSVVDEKGENDENQIFVVKIIVRTFKKNHKIINFFKVPIAAN